MVSILNLNTSEEDVLVVENLLTLLVRKNMIG